MGSNRLLGAASGDSEPAAFLKTKCVTLSVGFHTAIWNQHAVGMSESLCDLETGCAAESIGNCRNSTRTINFLLDRRPKKVPINGHKEILER